MAFDLCLCTPVLQALESLQLLLGTNDGSTRPRTEWEPVQTPSEPGGNFAVTVIFSFPSYFHFDSENSEHVLCSRQLTKLTSSSVPGWGRCWEWRSGHQSVGNHCRDSLGAQRWLILICALCSTAGPGGKLGSRGREDGVTTLGGEPQMKGPGGCTSVLSITHSDI